MPRVVVFDSGMGGLSVFKTIANVMKPLNLIYFADFNGFPYGDWEEQALNQRIVKLVGHIIDMTRPDAIVIASCSASSLSLKELQHLYPNVSFVGTPTGLKQAAELTRSGMISVLTSHGAARRAYRSDVVFSLVPDKDVSISPTRRMTSIIEHWLQGHPIDRQAVIDEMAPAFMQEDGRRTDTVVLGCTHLPLAQKQLAALAPWDVQWVEPSMLVAKRLHTAIGGNVIGDGERRAMHTYPATTAPQERIFNMFRFTSIQALDELVSPSDAVA